MTARDRTPAARATPRQGVALVIGAKSVLRALDEPGVRRVLVAADAPDETTGPVRRSAAAHGVTVMTVVSAAELGRRCGIARPVAAAADLMPSEADGLACSAHPAVHPPRRQGR